MKFEDLNTTRFLFDPKKPNFVTGMEKRVPFQFNVDKVNKEKALTYLVLMYDPRSELWEIGSYGPRKKEAAIMAGFDINKNTGRFSQAVENMVLGGHKGFNRAIMEYCHMASGTDMVSLAVYELVHVKASADILTTYDKNSTDLIEKLRKNILELKQRIFGTPNPDELWEALYERLEKERLDLRPETLVEKMKEDGLKGLNPYGEEYEINPIVFAGEKLPKE